MGDPVLKALFGSKTGMENLGNIAAWVRIGAIVEVPFKEEEKANDFVRGYRSGMARIWRTTYEIPREISSYFQRGFRFAWLAHIVGRRYNDEFPEAMVIYASRRY